MNKIVWNERKKMLATWYNNASLAMLVAGFISPFWTIIYGTSASAEDDVTRMLGFFVCVGIGSWLRYRAHQTLGSLIE